MSILVISVKSQAVRVSNEMNVFNRQFTPVLQIGSKGSTLTSKTSNMNLSLHSFIYLLVGTECQIRWAQRSHPAIGLTMQMYM